MKATIKWDHVVHYVNDLEKVKTVFEDHGLEAFNGGSHQQWGTYNVLSYFGLTYLEFLGVEDRTLAESIEDPNDVVRDAVKHLPKDEILSRVALRTNDIEAVRARLLDYELSLSPVMAGKRRDAEGQLLEWKMMTIAGDYQGLPYPFIIEWNGTDEEREKNMKNTGIIKPHGAGLVNVHKAIFSVSHPDQVARHWANLFELDLASRQLQVGEHLFIFEEGPENRLKSIRFKTDSDELKEKTIVIGLGYYAFD